MTRLLLGVMRALEPPVRFLVGGLFALAATLVACVQAHPEAGYPFPGRLAYQAPALEALLLGFMVLGGLAAAGWVARPRGPVGAASVLYLGLGAAGAIHALVPAAGVPRLVALLVGAALALRWSRQSDRAEVLRSVALLTFALVLVKFVVLDAVASSGGGVATWAARGLGFGLLTQPPLPPGDEYRVALVLLLFAAAMAARWLPLEDMLEAEAKEQALLAAYARPRPALALGRRAEVERIASDPQPEALPLPRSDTDDPDRALEP